MMLSWHLFLGLCNIVYVVAQEAGEKQSISATFDGRSYISFSLQRSRIVSNADEIVFEFRTTRPNGLIMHVGEQHDYIYVAMKDGMLEVTVNLGSGEYRSRVEPTGNKPDRYMDNQWHKVKILRDRNQVSILVDGSLLASGQTQGDFGTLTADGEFFVGGTSDPRSLPGSNVGENFVGSIRDVIYYGESITLEVLDTARRANIFIFIEGQVNFLVGDADIIDPITFRTEEAFLRLPRWNAAEIRGAISFLFRTTEANGIIMYAKGAMGMSDFFAFELLDGYLWLVLDLGSGAIRHKLNTSPLNDGEWHTVTLNRERQKGSLQVDSLNKVFMVPGSSRHLNLETKLILGGIDQNSTSNSLPMDLFRGVLRRGYVGCIAKLTLDDVLIDLPRYILNDSRDDVAAFCREEKPQCVSKPCNNHGSCSEGWNRFVCDCRMNGYTGKTCSEEVARLSFNGEQHMKVTLPDSTRSKFEDIYLRFRTRHSSGVLVATTCDTIIDLLMIELKDGAVGVVADYGQGLKSITAGANLDDNRWHWVHLSRNDSTLALSVDGLDYAEAFIVTEPAVHYFGAGILDYCYIEVGAVRDTANLQEIPHNFQGRMKQFLYNNRPYFDMARGGQLAGYELTAQFGNSFSQRSIKEPFTMTKEAHVQLPTPSSYDPHLTMFFQFKTTEPSGLIIYCGDGYDFIAVELVDGVIHYAFDLGSGTTVMKPNTGTLLNDNLWHEVSIYRDSRDRHVLRVDDSVVIARPVSYRNLDLTENFYIGGVEDFRYQILPMMVYSTHGFQGCFASLEINGEHQNVLGTAVSIEDETIKGCEAGVPSTNHTSSNTTSAEGTTISTPLEKEVNQTIPVTTVAPTVNVNGHVYSRIKPRRYDITDTGMGRYFRGWADVQGQGSSNDYCRVVGRIRKYLSCALAGTAGDNEYNFNSLTTKWFDPGYKDTWYMKDEDGDGKDDYCRCVGDYPNTWVSCMKAGETGFLGSYDFTPDDAMPNCRNRIVNPFLGTP